MTCLPHSAGEEMVDETEVASPAERYPSLDEIESSWGEICTDLRSKAKLTLRWLERLVPYFLVCAYFSEIQYPYNCVLLAIVVMWALVPREDIEKYPFLRQFDTFENHLWKNFKLVSDWIWTLRVPLLFTGFLFLHIGLMRAWIIALLVYPIVRWAFNRCPESLRNKIYNHIPSRIRSSPSLPVLNEGMDQCRPFILFWLYLCCAPFAMAWMAIHWCKGMWRQCAKPKKSPESAFRLTFNQNSTHDSTESDNNFYHSQAFAVTILVVFALGLPAWFSLAIYKQMGIGKFLASSPAVSVAMVPEAHMPGPTTKPLWIGTELQGQPSEAFVGSTDLASDLAASSDKILTPSLLDKSTFTAGSPSPQQSTDIFAEDASSLSAQRSAELWTKDAGSLSAKQSTDIFTKDAGSPSPQQSTDIFTKDASSLSAPLSADIWTEDISSFAAPQSADVFTQEAGIANHPPEPSGQDATYVTGYAGYWPWLRDFGIEPTMDTIFFVHFYIFGLASALAMLFLRAWLTFPLNFLTDEHKVEVSETGIRRHSHKGWFLYILTLNKWAGGGGCYDSLRWSDVKTLRHQEEGFTKLCPLPETAFKKSSLTYKLLNKFAALIDGVCKPMNTGSFIVFSMGETSNDNGRNIKINLNELTRDQRARLFYSVKQWAPHVVTTAAAEEKLLGSTVLNDVRYTQIWFDLLTSKAKTQRQTVLAPGETLRNTEYTITSRLSSGGQATAYLATRASGETCVLKEFILSTASSSSGALIESAREFEAEVSLLSQLNHDGIVRVQDFFADDGRVYVVLEHVQGQTLRKLVKQSGPLSQKEVVRIALELSDILIYLHSQNPPIVHRDVTPENIITQPDGRIKLIDFSLALKQDSRQTTDSCGKHSYTPPEQFGDEVTGQSDIYALGSTMGYLLTGVNPKPLTRSSPQLKAPDISTELNHIVERATELELDRRYESVDWLKLDLEAIASSAPALPCSANETEIAPLLEKLAIATEGHAQEREPNCFASSLPVVNSDVTATRLSVPPSGHALCTSISIRTTRHTRADRRRA